MCGVQQMLITSESHIPRWISRCAAVIWKHTNAWGTPPTCRGKFSTGVSFHTIAPRSGFSGVGMSLSYRGMIHHAASCCRRDMQNVERISSSTLPFFIRMQEKNSWFLKAKYFVSLHLFVHFERYTCVVLDYSDAMYIFILLYMFVRSLKINFSRDWLTPKYSKLIVERKAKTNI